MPENVQDQTISKRYATPIPDNQLPLDNDRRIIVDSTGCCSIAYFDKRSEELLDYFIDMMKWLEPNEVIIGAAAWCEPGTLFNTRLEYASTGVVAWLAGGADGVRHTVNVQISTSLGKIKLVQFVLQTYGVATDLAIVNAEGDTVIVADNDAPVPEVDYAPDIKAYPSSIEFPLTGTISGQSTQAIVLKNDGNAVGFIRRIVMTGDFSQQNAGIQRIEPGEFVQIFITFKPQTEGEHTGSIQIDVGEGLTTFATFTGQSVSANRITTQGRQLVLTDGATIKLKSINWFGAETEVFAPHGLWARNYKDIINQIKAMGFNSVRLPFSGDLCTEDRYPQTGVINGVLNEDLAGLPAIQVLDKIIAYMNEVGLYVILDHHRRYAGDGADGSPVDSTYTLDNWKASWSYMIERYAGLEFVLGADLHNEPHNLTWASWAELAEGAGNHILSLAPHWLIFVQGVGDGYWWGGDLKGVATRPVELSVPGSLVYSVHEYGQSVGDQPWLAKDNAVPAEWPMNLYGVWRQNWGFIFEQGIAPIWIGEVGGKFGIDGTGVISNTHNAQYERQWIYHLQRYMEGYFTGNNDRGLVDGEQGISFAYWSLNPNSGDTGGILQDDWTTEQSFKLGLIGMMLNNSDVLYIHGLTPLPWDGIAEEAQIVLSQGGQDYAVTIKDLNDKFNETNLAVGHVHFFAESVDPNVTFPRQTWLRVPGAEKTIRLAKADDSDILQQGGSDSITIAKANLPNVQLDVTGTISGTDLGTKTTNTTGAHTHSYLKPGYSGTGGYQGGNNLPVTDQTGSSGDHSHDVVLGSHNHTLTDAKTAALGSGTAIDVTNEYVTLAAWYRAS